jgi:hypothetical protein
MRWIFVIPLLLPLLLIIPVMMGDLPEVSNQNVMIEFQETIEKETARSGVFKKLDEEQFLVWLKDYDKTDENEPTLDYTCIHFSLDLWTNFYNDYGFHGVLRTWNRLTSGSHVMNAVLIGDDPYLPESWLVIEPQSDYVWRADQLPTSWYPIELFGACPDSDWLLVSLGFRECPFLCGYVVSKDSPVVFFMHYIDIEKWIKKHEYQTTAGWLYDNPIALT